jgi:hypothetical protein
MIVPGHGVRVVRMYLAAICGDKPALHAMIGLKSGNCHRCCHLCCFDLNHNMDPYDPSIHKPRNFIMLLKTQAFCFDCQKQLETNVDLSNLVHSNSAALKFIKFYGAQPRVTPFVEASLGWNCPSSVFEIAVRDIFHDLEAGLFPSIVMMVLRIVQSISQNDPQYRNAISLLDEFTSPKRATRHPPRYRKMDHTSFSEGCASLLLKTSTGQANSGSTGTTAGMRSSWSKVMMTALLVAIGTSDGLILPVNDHYMLKRKVRVTTTESEYVTYQDPHTHQNKRNKRTVSETQSKNHNVLICNPTRLCTQALAIALDVYAEFNRSVWTQEVVNQVEQKVRELQTCMTVLHQVMVAASRVSLNEEGYQVSISLVI